MHVVICSLVKNGMSYLPAYRKQLEALSLPPGTTWSLCILEGDSVDGSWEFLTRWASEDNRITIGREDVGEAIEGIDNRAARWARAGNACLDLIGPNRSYTHVLWLESDLSFPLELLSRLLAWNVDIVAPMVWIGGHFYDTWGFRDTSGRKWDNYPPYHPRYRSNALIEMGSVGSCVLMRREILDAGIRFRGPYETGLLVGICTDARSKGFRVFADTSTAILHPVSLWEEQMWKVTSIEVVDREMKVTSFPQEEIFSLGAAMYITALNEVSAVKCQQKIFKEIFRRWRTNHVDLKIETEPLPARRYRMIFSVKKPEGLANFPLLLNFLLWVMKLVPLKADLEGGRVFLKRGPFTWPTSFSGEVSIARADQNHETLQLSREAVGNSQP